MGETLTQLGGLLLGAIPTVIFVILIYGVYTALVHKPLVKVLAERREKTEGAVEAARAAISAAEGRTADYEQRLREARMTIFKGQEARRQAALQRRSTALAEARSRAQTEVESARRQMEQDKQQAQAALQGESQSLAKEIIRTVLQPPAKPSTTGAQG